ncbi:MAG: GNAT family N-acetyltransferase [Thermoplasmata archaeon]|nr:GNAT family N-acetyltransferase [Thermoplasmata archaeon]
MTLQVMDLDDHSEERFWQHVNKDPMNYHWFRVDWKYSKDDTKILMAIDDDKIEGMMLVFKDSIVQVRGGREAVEVLLDQLDQEEIEMMAPMDCEDMVLERYNPEIRNEMFLMHLEKGEEIVHREHEPVELSMEHVERISEIMRESYPDWWAHMTPDKVKENMGDQLWLGIKVDGEALSFGNTRFIDFGSNIGVVATHKDHRNRGYATSVVSALVEEILKRSDRALIHVLKDNYPAVHTYSKVGFKPFKSYSVIKKAMRIH